MKYAVKCNGKPYDSEVFDTLYEARQHEFECIMDFSYLSECVNKNRVTVSDEDVYVEHKNGPAYSSQKFTFGVFTIK